MHYCVAAVLSSLLCLCSAAAHAKFDAEAALVAVATNFRPVMMELVNQFSDSGYQVTPTFASTGKLYTQIKHGAPYTVFLAADQQHPHMLVASSLAEDQFTYATGQLVLVGSHSQQALQNNTFTRLAIANPKLAPYGVAAEQLLAQLGISEQVSGKLVLADNIGQAMAFFATGNSDLALVARSLIQHVPAHTPQWLVPDSLHSPIRQDAVRLIHNRDNPAADAFMAFLKSAEAQATIRSFGYL